MMKQAPPDLGHRYYGESDTGWISTDDPELAARWQKNHRGETPLVLDRHSGVWS